MVIQEMWCPSREGGTTKILDLRRFELPEFKGYSLWAENYDNEDDNPVIIGEEEVIWDLIGNTKSLRILDAGCGTGRHAIPMAKQGTEIIAYDPSSEMSSKAKAL